ncbi:SDR family NAD(P)-dependent oxidoreductase [Symbioplanes lichenis]|uniref:SDR family NAD(P)-dependent oxidoreductase n=1 Tax=Symbioplanes lichenis TaxID=1629072 RepID=UPI0027393BEE|nr:SDR family NAD(P)-dependent oxidoreductase [Actinoplanes lichenis]
MTTSDPVVVAGLACRFPEADGPGDLWRNVMARRRSFRRLPDGRLPLADYGGADPDHTYVTRAALLDGWHFDRARFRVPGDTYRAVDPSHWLALEVSADALADAGLPGGEGVDRDRAGVVLGNSLTGEFSRAATLRTRWPYVGRTVAAALAGTDLPPGARSALLGDIERRYKAAFPVPSDETLAGALANTIAGRVCNHFDFHGTGYTVDGACASSLLAVATAAEAVAAGHLDVALAGGVDLSLDPFELVGFARAGALARDEMRVYDRRPTGFLPGEGCGVLVLCRESYARERRLRAYARLLGWGTASDGRGGLTRPEVAGQRLALRRAYERAALDPARVRLVEGHGTGTEIGDLTEITALRDVRGPGAPTAALGSVKANIGHTKAAAGAAGLIKAVLALHHEVLPPATGCADPHPLLHDPATALHAPAEARPWPGPERYAAVSGFGFGGINVHAVLGGTGPTARRRLARHQSRLAARHPGREIVVCTADRPGVLAARLRHVAGAAPVMSRGELTDLAATLAAGHRGDAPVRFAAAVSTVDELAAAAGHAAERLEAGERLVLDRVRRVFVAAGAPLRVALLFSGQAAPCHPGPGALGRLLDELPPGYDDPLTVPDPAAGPAGTDVAQPAIMRSALAGLRWLDTLGVRAHAAAGHSLGELAALCWAGALTETEAYTLARARGAAMAEAGGTDGAMASLGTGRPGAETLVDGTGAVVAAENGPGHTVVSGPRAAVGRVVARARGQGLAATWLPVAHAFHSPAMAAAADPVRAAAARIRRQPLSRPVASTVTGAWLPAEPDLPALLTTQLTAPVRFTAALALLAADLYVEVGPGHVLAGLAGDRAVALDAGAPEADGLAVAGAALFAAGACDSVQPWFDRRETRVFDLDRPRAFLTNPCESTDIVVDEPAVEAEPRVVNATADPLEITRERVAGEAELDPAAVAPDARLLADLHLSSLRVGQLAAALAADLGRAAPTAPLELATATVAELAATLAALPPAGSAEPPVTGVAAWVRVFGAHLTPVAPPAAAPQPRDWEIIGAGGHPYERELTVAFPRRPGAGEPARLLALAPDRPAADAADDVVTALRAADADRRPLVVLHHGGIGAAVGRSLAAENPAVPVLVAETPATADGIRAAAAEAHRPLRPYAEVVLGPGGVRAEPVLRQLVIPPRDDAAIPLGRGDACVVTGGARGIGLECALALGAATGATMILLGRSPGDDPAVVTALRRATEAGVTARYVRADVTDSEAVADALRPLTVRGLLHAAGRNEPVRIAALTPAKLHATLAPKTALDHVLAALDPAALRFAVAFGSVIGRTGLAGQADYAIANEWLTRRCARLSAEHSDVKWLSVEWSAWSGTGMGERLGALDALVRQGLSPVPVATGTDLLLRLLATPRLPAAVLVTGRLPASPAVRWDDDETPAGRFTAARPAHTPGVELISTADLSLGDDPALAGHRIDGTVLLPAVLGLEAMAQAAAALGGKPGHTGLSAVAFARPVTVPEREPRRIRVAALAGEDGAIETVLRSAETGFATDHFRATCTDAGPARPGTVGPVVVAGDPMPAAGLYGPLFFHGPALRRVRGYHRLSAYRCLGSVTADPDARWFGAFHDPALVLGDPGARDAFLHILQGCLPDRRLLPVGADEIRFHGRPEGTLTVHARQRPGDGDELVFDLVVSGAGPEVVEEWSGLRLRVTGPLDPAPLPLAVLGALLTRTLRRAHPGLRLDLAVAPATRTGGERTREVAAWLADAPARHAPDGALLVAGPGHASASHLAGHVLVAAAPQPVAVDWEAAGPGEVPLGSGDRQVAAELGAAGAYQVWACRESLRKLGRTAPDPLLLTGAPAAGWTTLTAAGCHLHSTVVTSTTGPVAVCVGLGETP